MLLDFKPFDPHSYLTIVAGGRTVSTYKKNAIVFRQDDPAHAVYYMQTGTVMISIMSALGTVAVVALVHPGDFFGESCLNGDKFRTGTASAMTECKITRILKSDISSVLESEPVFSKIFRAHLLARIRQTESDLADRMVSSSEKRLARALLVLSDFGAREGDTSTLLVKISQRTLAEIVGTTVPRINFFMNKFRRIGLLDYNGRISVHRVLLGLFLNETLPG